jgi:hypothetical protein
LEDRLNELSIRSIKSNDVVNTQRKIQEMEKKMGENREQMEEMKISMSTILLHTLDERFPQGDIRTQGNHVNVEEIKIEPHNHD